MRYRVAVGAFVLNAFASGGAAQVRVGPEFQVNTYHFGRMYGPAVASDDSGNFVVVWLDSDEPLQPPVVFGRRFDSTGAALGSDFQVNTHLPSAIYPPSVASDAAGRFVVVWTSHYSDASGYRISGQRYDAMGARQGGEFRVNSTTTVYQMNARVASDATGNFVVVWHSRAASGYGSFDVFGQRYDSSGAAVGAEFLVNSYTTGGQAAPAVASHAGGSFLVAWTGRTDGSLYGIFAQRYDSSGQRQGSEFLVNTYTTDWQIAPSATVDADGNFVVVWSSSGQDGSGNGVFGQRYDAAGVARGGEFQINEHTTGQQGAWIPSPLSVASSSDGGFVAVWDSYGQDGSSYGVFGRRYDSSGAPTGPEFRLNSSTVGGQRTGALAAQPDGGFVVVWQSWSSFDQFGIFGQRISDGPDLIFADGFE